LVHNAWGSHGTSLAGESGRGLADNTNMDVASMGDVLDWQVAQQGRDLNAGGCGLLWADLFGPGLKEQCSF
jgi:hypothetical protein